MSKTRLSCILLIIFYLTVLPNQAQVILTADSSYVKPATHSTCFFATLPTWENLQTPLSSAAGKTYFPLKISWNKATGLPTKKAISPRR